MPDEPAKTEAEPADEEKDAPHEVPADLVRLHETLEWKAAMERGDA